MRHALLAAALLASTAPALAYNEYMPSITVRPGASVQGALDQAAAGFNSTVTLMPGLYPISTPLLMSSNTRLLCSPGSIITENNGTGWTGDNVGIENINHTATALTDQNIEVQGCSFNLAASSNPGAFHHIRMLFVSHVSVHNNTFNGGGDATAMIATYDSNVYNNYASNIVNACWDNYDGPQAFVVRDNTCSTTAYGVLATGSGGGYPTPAVPTIAQNGTITGNTINMLTRTGFAAIWAQGLGPPGPGGAPNGDGAQNVNIAGNHIFGDGVANFVCIKVSGASSNIVVSGNQCVNPGPTNSQAVVVNGGGAVDPGGVPIDIVVDGNLFDNVNVAAGNIAAIVISAPNSKLTSNRVTTGSFPSCIWINAADDTAFNNMCDQVWTTAEYNLTGAVRVKYSTNPVGSGNFTLGANNGNVVVGPGTALGTAATANFLSPPFTNGVPSGTPASTGMPACVWNDTSKSLNCWSPAAGAWTHMTFTAGGG